MKSLQKMRAELAEIREEERFAWFEMLVNEFDQEELRNERKHWRKDRRYPFDISLLDRDNEDEIIVPIIFRSLNTSEYWLDSIFSRHPEDLPELVSDSPGLSNALRNLSKRRKEALFHCGVRDFTSDEIAAYMGVSGSNVRKLFRKAVKEIRENILIDKSEGCNYNVCEMITKVGVEWICTRYLKERPLIGCAIQNMNTKKSAGGNS